jgi:hypothetical protein
MGQQQGRNHERTFPSLKLLRKLLHALLPWPKLHSFIFSPRYQYKGFVGHVNKA